MKVGNIEFPEFTGKRCLMLPYIQGVPNSVPKEFREGYEDILASVYFEAGEIGYLTIDESVASQGKPHRGKRARYGRALHTEAGIRPDKMYAWGRPTWGGLANVTLDRDVEVLIANNIDNSCAVWNAQHENTSEDGDIGNFAEQYPYDDAIMMKAGEVHRIGILTPHESLPVRETTNRQFLRIVSAGVHGREEYFTHNPLINQLH